MTVQEFIEKFKQEKFANAKIAPNAVNDYIVRTLEVKACLPFNEKRRIAEEIVQRNTVMIDGIKKNSTIDQYMDFILSMLKAHTNLEFGEDAVVDYDLLVDSGLLQMIIGTFQTSYNECDILLNMALASELEENNANVLLGRFLNGILDRLDVVLELVSTAMDGVDIKDILGANFKEEDLAKLKGFLDKYN